MRKLVVLLAAAGMLGAAVPAMAADLGGGPLPESDAFSWTGGYIGLNGSYTWGTSKAHYSDPTNGATLNTIAGPLDSDPIGWSGGVTIGANEQMDSGIVAGVEGDVDYSYVTAGIVDNLAGYLAHPGGYNNTITSTTDLSGTLRGRAGVALGNLLPYLTGGLAVAHVTVDATDGPVSESAFLYGWTVGGGLEVAYDEHWSAKGEALYTDLGSHTWFSGKAYQSTSTSTSVTARAGINYKF